MSNNALRSASALALMIGASGMSAAYAQQPATSGPNPQNQTVTTQTAAQQATTPTATSADSTKPSQASAGATDKIVITGSLIATTPEDAPKPVEVYSAEDLKEQGTPTVTEFIRSLTLSYGDDLGFGQASPDVPQGSGFGNANLRGLGSNGTLVLMNGQKLAPWNGSFGADVNTVPMEALQAVEVLKGGASATYGAGAVGGVINFRTRRDIDAPQVSIEKQVYDGSDGYYKIDFLTGWVGDAGNLLVSLSHSHEDPMLMSARDFSSQPFNINPAAYTLTGSNPGTFQVSASPFLTATSLAVAFPGVNDYRTASDCTAIGGYIANQVQPGSNQGGFANSACGFPQAPFQSLVNENDASKAFVEFNADITENQEVSFSVNFSTSKTDEQRIPTDPALVQAINRGFTGCSTTCNYVVPAQVQTYTTAGAGTGAFARNPFVDDFMARTGLTSAQLPTTGALYMGLNWRPLLFGGNPLSSDGRRHDKFERDSLQVNASTKGKFTDNTWIGPFLNGVHYEFSGQYNQYMNTYWQPDIFASRLQNAMLGYGGPSCNAIDRVPTDYTSAASYNRTAGIQSDTAPGTNGCQWFNPFASAFAQSVVNGATNPQFNSGSPVLGANATARPTGYANPQDMLDWMWGEGVAEFKLESATFNGLLSGTVPNSLFTLPGGDISWAVGSEWRQVEGRRSTRDDNAAEQAMNTQDCVWPDRAVTNVPAQVAPGSGVAGCTTAGARYGTGRLNIVAGVPPTYYDNQTAAIFGEFQFPILDNVQLQYNVRHEEWNGGDLKGDIYTVAGKWDITDNLWVRSDYGTNYRADAALELRPGDEIAETNTQSRFGTGFQVTRFTTVSTGIAPEDDKTFNLGVGWQSDLGEGRIRANVNFFEILIDGQVATTSDTTILNNVFGTNTTPCQTNRGSAIACGAGNEASGLPNTAGTSSSGQFANCNARLIDFVTFNTPCLQGITTAASLTETHRYQVNGPGFVTNGIDYTVDYAHPLWGGTFSAQVTATNNLVYKARGYDVNGIIFDSGGNRLGRANYTSTGNESRRWRANGQIRWSNDEHNISLRANYSSGVYNEAWEVGGLTPIIDNPGTTPDVYSSYGIFPKEYLDFDLNYIWTPEFWKGLEARVSVLNIFDKDPSPAQGRSGYYNATGNPRGRILEL
ncbi:MAG TPA: TonB-dependent receptor plug domain-containing protein, partial [Hyphomonadaceae bacterium]|nr:TonB-dependent receptor plug domain-containing protein [Hyphomonadaceae bacterium]